jgi:hypothetical protein
MSSSRTGRGRAVERFILGFAQGIFIPRPLARLGRETGLNHGLEEGGMGNKKTKYGLSIQKVKSGAMVRGNGYTKS